MDTAKSLESATLREERLAALDAPHVAPLTAFVRQLRSTMGETYDIPYFDPFDGGVEAECLFLLEAPGKKAVRSGFVSRNNPDETAKNLFLLLSEAGIERRRTALWNIVPWYIGDGARIRAAKEDDIRTAAPAIAALLALLPALRVIALVGGKAASAKDTIAQLAPRCSIFTTAHPSPMFINRAPGNRSRILADLHRVAEVLGPADRMSGSATGH